MTTPETVMMSPPEIRANHNSSVSVITSVLRKTANGANAQECGQQKQDAKSFKHFYLSSIRVFQRVRSSEAKSTGLLSLCYCPQFCNDCASDDTWTVFLDWIGYILWNTVGLMLSCGRYCPYRDPGVYRSSHVAFC